MYAFAKAEQPLKVNIIDQITASISILAINPLDFKKTGSKTIIKRI
jgi:hypothetical protein